MQPLLVMAFLLTFDIVWIHLKHNLAKLEANSLHMNKKVAQQDRLVWLSNMYFHSAHIFFGRRTIFSLH